MSLEVGDLASAVNCTPMKAAVLAQVADGWVGPPAVPQAEPQPERRRLDPTACGSMIDIVSQGIVLRDDGSQ